jgi:hypothetical protein
MQRSAKDVTTYIEEAPTNDTRLSPDCALCEKRLQGFTFSHPLISSC